MKFFTSKFLEQSTIYWPLLALAPALGGATTFMNGLVLGIATWITVVFSGILIIVFRKLLTGFAQVIFLVVVSSTMVTLIQIFMETFYPEMHSELIIFIPLIVLNVLVLRQIRLFSVQDPGTDLMNSFTNISVFVFILMLVGGLREILGEGDILGQGITGFYVETFDTAPGAALILAFIIASSRFLYIFTSKKHTDTVSSKSEQEIEVIR